MVLLNNRPGRDFPSLVHGVLARTGWSADDRFDCHLTGEIARGVDCFLKRADGDGLPAGRDMWRLAAMAFRSAGDTGRARRLLAITSGIMRRTSFLTAAGKPVWVLDLMKSSILSEERLELFLMGAVAVVLDSTAGAWDESGGRGMLGLRNVVPACREVRGRSASAREISALAAEIRRFCAVKLSRMAEERSWEETPSVVDLDYRR